MKIAYFDCTNGIAGDMVLGALVDAGVELSLIEHAIDSLGIPDLRLSAAKVDRCGFKSTKVHVDVADEKSHRHLPEIIEMISHAAISDSARQFATDIFRNLAQAEATVHGTSVESVHFHEVGAADSIADIVGSAVGLDALRVDRFECSPVPLGNGTIQIAHGTVAIPAPATLELLRSIPTAKTTAAGEMTTPTGAAIVRTVCSSFGAMGDFVPDSIGYGAGDRNPEDRPNLLRLVVGESRPGGGVNQVSILETNLDDVSPEIIGYCFERLLDAGALDVYTTPIAMKKNRPATKITVLCDPAMTPELELILFAETGTLGVRRTSAERSVLPREQIDVETSFGSVRGVLFRQPDGREAFTPEYESCREVANSTGQPLASIYELARSAYRFRAD